jgi:hypothetical protein
MDEVLIYIENDLEGILSMRIVGVVQGVDSFNR